MWLFLEVFAHICRWEKVRRYVRTVSFLSDLGLFSEREEDLLRSCLGDSTLEVGRDVDSTVWPVYLTLSE